MEDKLSCTSLNETIDFVLNGRMAVFGANGREEVLQFQVVRDHVDPLVSQSFID